jgi:hypothetical protein
MNLNNSVGMGINGETFEDVKLTTHLQLVPRLKFWELNLNFQQVLMTWYFVN